MADDPRYLAEARIARLITALGEATSEEFAKTLETGGRRRIVKKTLPAPPENAGSTIHRVRVELYYKPPIWRRLEIPSAMPLDQVSKVLQAAFGWSRYQTHQFETVYGRYGAPEHSGESSELDDWAPPEDETPVTLAQVVPAKNARKISYVCNFHAMRRLGITLEEIAPAEPGTKLPALHRRTARRPLRRQPRDPGRRGSRRRTVQPDPGHDGHANSPCRTHVSRLTLCRSYLRRALFKTLAPREACA